MNGTYPRPSATDIRWAIVYWDAILEHYLRTDTSDDEDEEHAIRRKWDILGTVIAAACEGREIDSSAISDATEWFSEYRRRSGIGYEWSMAEINVFNEATRKMRPGEEEMTKNAKRLLFRLTAKLDAELPQDDDSIETVLPKALREALVDLLTRGQAILAETDKSQEDESHEPDKNGLVLNPLDPSAYVPAMEILNEHTPPSTATTYKQLKRILHRHPEVRRTRPKGKQGKPRLNRLDVHLADWTKLKDELLARPIDSDGWPKVSDEEKASRKAKIRRTKKPRQ